MGEIKVELKAVRCPGYPNGWRIDATSEDLDGTKNASGIMNCFLAGRSIGGIAADWNMWEAQVEAIIRAMMLREKRRG